MRFAWPADIEEAEDGISVSFPDIPGAITFGSTRAEALERASDALASLISAMIENGEPVPTASEAAGRPLVSLAPLDAAKIALHMAMVEHGVSNVELGRKLGLTEKAVRRLVDPLHQSKIEKVDAALRILGKRLEIAVAEAA